MTWSTNRSLGDIIHEVARGPASLKPAFTFLAFDDNIRSQQAATYQQIDIMGRRIAALLSAYGPVREERVIIFANQSLDNIHAILGVIYAAAVFVILPPPTDAGKMARFRAVLKAATPKFILCGSRQQILAIQTSFDSTDELPICINLAEKLPLPLALPIKSEPEAIACLQYTSGSTAFPKGIMLSHRNIIHNVQTLARYSNPHAKDKSITIWTPFFHNVGLVGGIFYTLLQATHCVVLRPEDFTEAPLRLFEAIAHYKTTATSGPNSVFQMCTNTIRPVDLVDLNLQTLDTIATGAEATHYETLCAFSELFAPTGVLLNNFKPGYGLSECTSMVSGRMPDDPLLAVFVDHNALQEHRFVPVEKIDPNARPRVASGTAGADFIIKIVNPETCKELPEGLIGEVWIQSASVALGYWREPAETQKTFKAQLEGVPGFFLRSGDLGAIYQGNLFITGRIKDLILINGKNYYSTDIVATIRNEQSPLAAVPMLAFSTTIQDKEKLIILIELTNDFQDDPQATTAKVKKTIFSYFGFSPHDIILVKTHSLPRTDNNKIMRRKCEELYSTEKLAVIYALSANTTSDPAANLTNPDPDIDKLSQIVQKILQRSDIGAGDDLFGFGIDSLGTITLINEIQKEFGVKLSMSTVFEHPTIQAITNHLQVAARGHPFCVERSETPKMFPLPPPMLRCYVFQTMEPETLVYHIPLAVPLLGRLDMARFEAAFVELIARHESLRISCIIAENEPVMMVSPSASFHCDVCDLSQEPDKELLAVKRINSFPAPIDLAQAPLFKVGLLKLADDRHVLLLDIHHLVADGTSLEIIKEEFLTLYSGKELTDKPYQYRDYAHWFAGYQASPAFREAEKFWLEEFCDELPRLNLPLDFKRPPNPSEARDIVYYKISPSLTKDLRQVMANEQVTMSMLLLAIYNVLLQKLTGNDDIVVGTLVSCRTSPELRGIVGYLANVLAIRSRPQADLTFQQFLRRLRSHFLKAYEYQHYPIQDLIEKSGYRKDPARGSIYDTMFALQNFYTRPNLEHLPFTEFELPGLKNLDDQNMIGLNDMKWRAYEIGDHLEIKAEYCSQIFLRESIQSFLTKFTTIAAIICQNTAIKIGNIDVLTDTQKAAALALLKASSSDDSYDF